MLSKENILSAIKPNVSSPNIILYDSLPSTNDTAIAFAKADCPNGTLIVTSEQTNGRGRGGKNFFSPKNKGIYMSLVLRPKFPKEYISILTPMAAVAVAQSIECVIKKSATIKWVNDVFVDRKKVCGILTEAEILSSQKYCEYVVVGIGMNLFPPEDGFPSEIKDTAGYLLQQREDNMINIMIAQIWNRFMEYYTRLPQVDFWQDYVERSLLLGRKIVVLQNNIRKNAVALEIDRDFRLKVQYDDGKEEWLTSGDVSIKL